MTDPKSDLGRLMGDFGTIKENDKGETPQEFVTGDTVLLKSGSLPMTVGKSSGLSSIECIWMTPSGDLHVHAFPSEILEHASDNEQHVNQQLLTQLNLKLQIKKLEGFENEIQKNRIGLASPQMQMPRKRR